MVLIFLIMKLVNLVLYSYTIFVYSTVLFHIPVTYDICINKNTVFPTVMKYYVYVVIVN